MDYQIELVANATDGLHSILSKSREGMDFAIVDVMLTQGEDKVTFSDQMTRNGVITGLILVDKLLNDASRYPWHNKLLIFSRASDPTIVVQIENYASRNRIKYLRKSNDLKATQFIQWLKDNSFVNK
ncbi:MAG: hypothetical protein WA268_00580 [Xanthobacteraceae bacterium]